MDRAQIRTLDSGWLAHSASNKAANGPFISSMNVTVVCNSAHSWPRFPAVISRRVTPMCCHLHTHANRGEMRQEGIGARSYLGFPQTGMKEGFVIARPLAGVASLHVRHTGWGKKNGGGVVVTLYSCYSSGWKKDDTCSIGTQPCQRKGRRFDWLFVGFLLVHYDLDLLLHGLMT